jgi:hypothetical protein
MRYRLVCLFTGLVFGWVPGLLHGPIPYKYDVLHIDGRIAVAGFYVARLLIGLMVGLTSFPEQWYVRGPMCGFLVMFPLTMISLATPGCGGVCMFWNLVTATTVGFAVAATARGVTGRNHA